MSEDRQNPPRSWLERFTSLFSDDPQSREDIKDIVQEAAERSIVDADTLNIIEGALQVSEMQVGDIMVPRSEEHTSELQSRPHLVCRLLLEKKKNLQHIEVLTQSLFRQRLLLMY